MMAQYINKYKSQGGDSMKFKSFTLAICFTILSLASYAADVEGDPGPTIAPLVEIDTNGGLNFIGKAVDAAAINAGTVNITDSFCIYSNVVANPAVSTNPGFDINIVSANGTNDFIFQHSSAEAALNVTYTAALSGAASGPVTENVPATFTFSSPPSATCTGGLVDNVILTLTIPNLATVAEGIYSDTLGIYVGAPGTLLAV